MLQPAGNLRKIYISWKRLFSGSLSGNTATTGAHSILKLLLVPEQRKADQEEQVTHHVSPPCSNHLGRTACSQCSVGDDHPPGRTPSALRCHLQSRLVAVLFMTDKGSSLVSIHFSSDLRAPSTRNSSSAATISVQDGKFFARQTQENAKMLVLKQKPNEAVYIGEDTQITVVDVWGDRARLSF